MPSSINLRMKTIIKEFEKSRNPTEKKKTFGSDDLDLCYGSGSDKGSPREEIKKKTLQPIDSAARSSLPIPSINDKRNSLGNHTAIRGKLISKINKL